MLLGDHQLIVAFASPRPTIGRLRRRAEKSIIDDRLAQIWAKIGKYLLGYERNFGKVSISTDFFRDHFWNHHHSGPFAMVPNEAMPRGFSTEYGAES